MKKIDEILNQIGILEGRHTRKGDEGTRTKLIALRDKLQSLCMESAKAAIAFCTYYEQGNKCSKILARALRRHDVQTYISQVARLDGSKAITSADIAEEQVAVLESTITLEEFEEALAGTRNDKTPGPDGFSAIYYKTFKEFFAPRFVGAFGLLGEGLIMPPGLVKATITLIYKEGKDPASCSSYRPIALLNTDVKLYAEILANRLKPLLASLIHLDQAGFTPKREARNNTI